MKYKFFENGIGPNEFNKSAMRDIKDIMDIKDAMEERKQRESDIQETLMKMGKW